MPAPAGFKDMGVGRQPASLRQAETVLSIYGSTETLTIPCVTSTKVGEMKEMLAIRCGVDPSSLRFVSKIGCAVRQQLDFEEIARKVTVVGIQSFERQKTKYEDPMVIIGAGHIGLRHGLWFLKYHNENFIIFDRRNRVGGTSWITQANKTSKLQTELGTYHLQYDETNPVPRNMPTWPSRDQLLDHFEEVSREFGLLPYVRLNTNVQSMDLDGKSGAMSLNIEQTNGEYAGVAPPKPTGKGMERVACSAVFMYPGNLSWPRIEEYPGEEDFGGSIVYAMCDNFDYTQVTGKDVIICGHGAFGVENIRTCCEYSAKKIYLVCRRTNLACPRVVSWFANQSRQAIPAWLFLKSSEPMYDLIGFDPWSYHSVMSNEARTSVTIHQKARFGIGDVYFLALSMGKCEVIVDKVKRMSEGTVHLEGGRKLEASVMLKVFGFTGDYEVDKLLKIKEMTGLWANGDNRRFIASEFPGVFAQNFGGTSLSPGAITWVEQATYMMDYPRDWRRLLDSNMLPINKPKPEENRPAYVIDARAGMTIGMIVPSFCVAIADRYAFYGEVKHAKQWECHPIDRFLQEASDEWAEYGKSWKALDPNLKDPPPYPYDLEKCKAYLAEEQQYYERQRG